MGWRGSGHALAALIVLSAAAPGCRSQEGRDGKIRLRFSGYTGNPVETRVMAELVREFNDSHPEIVVAYEPITGQYYPKLLAMLVSDTAPDVFYLDTLYFKPFLAKKRILLSLEPLLAKTGTKKADFLPQLVDAFTADGALYGVAKDFNALALFYNKDMLDAAGIGYPDETWDVERLRDAAKRTTKRGGPYGFALKHDRVDQWLSIAHTFGADVIGADGRSAIGGPEAARSLDFYAGLKMKDGAAIYPSEVGATYVQDAFGRRTAAMTYDGSWMIGYLAESNPDVRYGVAELPSGPKGRSNLLFTVAYSIPQSSRHPEAAWTLIEYLTSEAAQARITWALPSRRAASERYVADHPDFAPVLKGASYARPWEFGPKSNRVEARLSVALQQVFLGGRSSADALRDAAQEIDRIGGL